MSIRRHPHEFSTENQKESTVVLEQPPVAHCFDMRRVGGHFSLAQRLRRERSHSNIQRSSFVLSAVNAFREETSTVSINLSRLVENDSMATQPTLAARRRDVGTPRLPTLGYRDRVGVSIAADDDRPHRLSRSASRAGGNVIVPDEDQVRKLLHTICVGWDSLAVSAFDFGRDRAAGA